MTRWLIGETWVEPDFLEVIQSLAHAFPKSIRFTGEEFRDEGFIFFNRDGLKLARFIPGEKKKRRFFKKDSLHHHRVNNSPSERFSLSGRRFPVILRV